MSAEEWHTAREAALALAEAEQYARDARFRPLECSVLNWPTRPIGAEPVCRGLLGSSRLPRTYADFDEEAMGINLGQMRIRMHYWLSERKALDEVVAELQDGVRSMVQCNLESATGEQLGWSKAGFPTLTNVAPLAGDVLFRVLRDAAVPCIPRRACTDCGRTGRRADSCWSGQDWRPAVGTEDKGERVRPGRRACVWVVPPLWQRA